MEKWNKSNGVLSSPSMRGERSYRWVMLGTVNIAMAVGSFLHIRAKFPYDILDGTPPASLGSPVEKANEKAKKE